MWHLRLWVYLPSWVSISVGPSSVKVVPECFRGMWSGRGVGRSGTLIPPIHGPHSPDRAPICSWIKLAALPSLPSCHRSFEDVGPHTLMVGGHPQSPPGRMRRHALSRQGWGLGCGRVGAPSSGKGFSFRSGPLPMVGYFFGAMTFERFFRKCLVGEKSKYRGSALNESTNLWWRFFCHERLDGRSIAQDRIESRVCVWDKAMHNTKRDVGFLCENP